MCGITGFIDHNHRIGESHLKTAAEAIKHRGGNGSGFIFDKKALYTLGLANERLATIGLSELGQQPLTSICGNYSITFNGTIYNYLELREALIKYGLIFSTLTDTEVILESYKKWGINAFEKLEGSYAFVILDRKINQLLVARDEIGSKPLYYYKTKGFYAFGSEIRALLAYTGVEKKINHNAIATYFRYGYFTDEQTIYENIFKHKKGVITIIDLHSGNNYDMPILRQKHTTTAATTQGEEEILAKIEELLTESILKRNAADVPVGVLLSASYDNAAVAAILQKNQSKRIKTFTIGFKHSKLDEAPQAKKIAEYLKTNHHEYYLDKNDALKLLSKLPEVFDEPVGNSDCIALLFLAQKAKKDIKVLLGAQGADELFGGYSTYAEAIKLNAFDESSRPKILKTIVSRLLTLRNPKIKEALATKGLFNKYLDLNACFTLKEIDQLLQHPTAPTNKHLGVPNIKGLLTYDLQNHLPNNNLYKTDRCLMYHGIDSRDAMLKTELIDYLNTLDPEWFNKDGKKKYLLKKITDKYIPTKLINSTREGFAVPLAAWLKTIFRPMVEKYLSAEMLAQQKLFNDAEVDRIKTTFYRKSTVKNTQQVWLLLQFQMWYERWMTNGVES